MKKFKNIAVTAVFIVLTFGLCAWFVFKPADDFSDSERRLLLKFPELSVENVLSGKFMSDFESYTLDQFPLRDGFRTVKAIVSTKLFMKRDNNDIYVKDGYAAAVEYPLKSDSVENAVSRINNIINKYTDESNKVYLSIIPDKNYFLSKVSGRLSLDYESMVSQLKTKVKADSYIDIFPDLSLDDYYKTDTHWKQENLIPVADKLLDSMGTGSDFTQLSLKSLDKPFYGVYCGQSALPLEAERIQYFSGGYIDSLKVYDFEHSKDIPVYDMEKANGKDPYEMYLSGSISLLSIDNPQATSDKELVIFRDSFGSSIAPLLASGYSKVTVVDIRYISSYVLGNFIDFENADVLFLYSTLVLNNSEQFK